MTNNRSSLETGRTLLMRSREEDLTPSEEKRLEQLLESYPELRAEKKELHETEKLVAQAAPESFAPFFSTRVMSRIERRYGDQAFVENLAFFFRRLALAVLLLAAGLATYNTTTAPPTAKDSFVERVVGIPSATLEDAYSLNLYDAP